MKSKSGPLLPLRVYSTKPKLVSTVSELAFKLMGKDTTIARRRKVKLFIIKLYASIN
tara:strand:- start:3343 stop:3513 length:171 start_codon:yes stop_codon:yes gene_type:complete